MSHDNTTIVSRRDERALIEIRPDGPVKPMADETDWQKPRAMSDGAVEAAALADPDAQPVTEEAAARMLPVPRVKTLRRALGSTQDAFAERYRIPIGTLRDWEQARAEPDQPAGAYSRAIAGDPEGVRRALRAKQP